MAKVKERKERRGGGRKEKRGGEKERGEWKERERQSVCVRERGLVERESGGMEGGKEGERVGRW